MKISEGIKQYNKYDVFNIIFDFNEGSIAFDASSLSPKIKNLLFNEDGSLKVFVSVNMDTVIGNMDCRLEFVITEEEIFCEFSSLYEVKAYASIMNQFVYAIRSLCIHEG